MLMVRSVVVYTVPDEHVELNVRHLLGWFPANICCSANAAKIDCLLDALASKNIVVQKSKMKAHLGSKDTSL